MKRALGEDTPIKVLDYMKKNNFHVYKTAYESCIQKMDINQYSEFLSMPRADLVFSKNTHLDRLLIDENIIAVDKTPLQADISDNNEEDLLFQIEEYKKELLKEKNEKELLLRRIIKPNFTEVLKCIGHFIKK